MLIPTDQIITNIKAELKKRVETLKDTGVQPKLCTVLIGHSPEQESFVRIKKQVGEELGIAFEFSHLQEPISCKELNSLLCSKSNNKTIHGIIVQQPLPASLIHCHIYSSIDDIKEIEGHKETSPFLPPIGLAALTGWIATIGQKRNSWILADKDYSLLKSKSEGKSILVIGRGITGGAPITYTLDHLDIKSQVIHSETKDPESILAHADVIITAVGKKIIHKNNIKQGAILLNLGLEKRQDRLRGDYDEEDIEDVASFYTKTPGGLGPIDVLYLYSNLITAAEKQLPH